MMKRNFIVGLTSLFIMSGNVNAQEAQADTTGVRVNPFLESWEGNPYRIPPFSRITEDDYIPALQEGIRLQDEAIRAIVENRDEATFENTILAMENSSEVLDKVEGVLFNVVEAHATPRLHEIVNEAAQMLSAQSDKVYMNPFLFRRVKRIKEQKPALDAVQQKLLDDVYREFVLGGAELDKEAQDELMQINVKLSELENTFGQNVLKATAQYELWVEDASRLEGLPEDALRRAAEKAAQKGKTGWVFGLDNPTVMPFLQYVKDADLRKEILDGYTGRCQAGSEYDNTSVVQQIVALRLRKARLLGYPDYASYALQTRMAQTPQAVYDLLDPIWTAALERAKQELAEMKQYRKKTEKYKGAFLPSDWRYYAEKVRAAKYALDENALKEYLSVDSVRNGIFYLCKRLYNIDFEQIYDVEFPTPNTTAYVCKDADGTVLGVIYMDMEARPGYKSGGAWNTNYVEQDYDSAGRRLTPVTSIVCNFTPPLPGQPMLLNMDEAETFFHEFGHALHTLFAEVSYKGMHDVPRDFVELPSQIMEHWVFHPDMLKAYAHHYKTGEPMPQEMVDRIGQVQTYGQGFATTELLAAALLDMDYHTLKAIAAEDTSAGGALDPAVFESTFAQKRALIPEILPRYRTNYFSHTMEGGYSAGYYCYTWAEVLDCDAFEAFEQSGNVLNREIGESFRQNILKNGGMYPAMDMFMKFRGHKPDAKALLRSRGLGGK